MRRGAFGPNAIARATKSQIYAGRLEYIPTKAAPKRTPDGAFSDKSREIPGIRRINRGLDTIEFSHLVAKIKHIAE